MILKTKFKGLFIYKNKNFKDKRGYFREIIRENKLSKKFPFLVMSFSKQNVVRGLHIQTKNSQGKFVTVVKGKIFDVAVDLRKKSKTFGKYVSLIISDKSDFSFYIPKGFAHGFMCISKRCTVNYKCSSYRNKTSEKTLTWNDPKVNINWPLKKPILSKKDKKGLNLNEFKTIK